MHSGVPPLSYIFVSLAGGAVCVGVSWSKSTRAGHPSMHVDLCGGNGLVVWKCGHMQSVGTQRIQFKHTYKETTLLQS